MARDVEERRGRGRERLQAHLTQHWSEGARESPSSVDFPLG